jgi:hypothetical protein
MNKCGARRKRSGMKGQEEKKERRWREQQQATRRIDASTDLWFFPVSVLEARVSRRPDH